MKTKTDWAFRFFNTPDYLELYQDMTGPARTQAEIGFCDRVIGWQTGDCILDAPCGAGRHSIELGKRGLSVTGLDFSSYLLEVAEEDTRRKNFPNGKPRYVRGLLQKLPFLENTFDSIICMFSSYGYGEDEQENLKIMQEYNRILKPGGKLLIDVMNRHFIVPRLNPVYESVQHGLSVREERSITNGGRRLHNVIRVKDRDGSKRQYLYNPWLFNGFELTLLASKAHMDVIKVYGSFRGEEYTEKSERAMLLAAKKLVDSP